MNDNSKKYWTDDPELVEKYILNKISAEEKKRLDAEIADCEPCKAKLQEEMEITAGIRHYGRDILKARLRKKLQRERATQFFSYQYIGLAAAVVIIAIGLGAYQLWFSDLTAPKQFHKQEIVFIQTDDSSSVNAETDNTEQQQDNEKSIVEQKESSSQRIGLSEESKPVQSAPTVASGTAGTTDALTNDAFASTGSPSSIWLIGQVVMVSESETDRVMGASEIAKDDKVTLSDQRRSISKMKSSESISLSKKSNRSSVVLQQRAIKDLPIERFQQRIAQQRTIETLLERTDNGIQLTLFDDSIKESDMKNAVIERPSEDSIVVSVSNQRIAYRLPSGWNTTSSGKR